MTRQWRYILISCAIAVVAAVAMIAITQRHAPPSSVSNFSTLTYDDSLVSVNDRCMVRHMKLNPDVHPVYVNGLPMGFC